MNLGVLSFFVAGRGNVKSRPFLRADTPADQVPGGDSISYLKLATTAKPTLFIGGVDLTFGRSVHLIANIERAT